MKSSVTGLEQYSPQRLTTRFDNLLEWTEMYEIPQRPLFILSSERALDFIMKRVAPLLQ